MTAPNGGSGPVSPRELYSTLDAIRSGLAADIKAVQATVESKLAEIRQDMAMKQQLHEQEHQKDRDRRSSLFRWAVTTMIATAALAVSVYIASRGG